MTSHVVKTLHDDDGHRCIKVIKQADGTFGFKEYRREPEDAGGWTLVSDHPHGSVTEKQALGAARAGVPWLRDKAASIEGTQ